MCALMSVTELWLGSQETGFDPGSSTGAALQAVHVVDLLARDQPGHPVDQFLAVDLGVERLVAEHGVLVARREDGLR
jgi:hypothetical protein